jgi:hypothetical protein
MAGFEVSINGRFWVSTEADDVRDAAGAADSRGRHEPGVVRIPRIVISCSGAS